MFVFLVYVEILFVVFLWVGLGFFVMFCYLRISFILFREFRFVLVKSLDE